jgi:hypothetical protein
MLKFQNRRELEIAVAVTCTINSASTLDVGAVTATAAD